MDKNEVSLKIEEIFAEKKSSDFNILARDISSIWKKGKITKGANLIKKDQREQSGFIGIDFKFLELIAKAICKNIKKNPVDFLPLAITLWKDFGREGRIISTYLFGQIILKQPAEVISTCKELTKTCISWEECDNMAMKGLEPIFRKETEEYLDTLNSWIIDENKWIKRAAATIVGRLPMVKKEYTMKCLNIIIPGFDHKDLDVMRAYSFALRISARGDIKTLKTFIKENTGGQTYSKIWIFSDFIKSMTKKFLPEFKELLPDYEKWEASLSDPRSLKTIKSAIKILKSLN